MGVELHNCIAADIGFDVDCRSFVDIGIDTFGSFPAVLQAAGLRIAFA